VSNGQPGYAVIHEEEAELVRQIFHWYVTEGISTSKIAKRLNQIGVHPRKGGRGWAPSAIRLMLINETYIGKAYYNRTYGVKPKKPRNPMKYHKHEQTTKKRRSQSEWIEIEVPSLIDEDTFRKAGEQLKKNTWWSVRNNTKHQYLLRRLVRCGECGYKMCGVFEGKYGYYTCRKGRDLVETHREKKCTSRSVRLEYLDKVVWAKITDLLEKPEMMIDQYKRQKDVLPFQGTQKQCQKLEQQIKRNEKQIQRLIDAYQMEIITIKDLDGRKNNLERKISQAQEQIRDIQTAEKEEINYKKIFESIETFCNVIKQGIEHASFNDKRRIVELLIEEIVVTNGKVEIHHIIPFGKNANLQLDDRDQLPSQETLLPPQDQLQELPHPALLLHVLRPPLQPLDPRRHPPLPRPVRSDKRRSSRDIQILRHHPLHHRPRRMIPCPSQ
jgi:site-specific DNA recombinase